MNTSRSRSYSEDTKACEISLVRDSQVEDAAVESRSLVEERVVVGLYVNKFGESRSARFTAWTIRRDLYFFSNVPTFLIALT